MILFKDFNWTWTRIPFYAISPRYKLWIASISLFNLPFRKQFDLQLNLDELMIIIFHCFHCQKKKVLRAFRTPYPRAMSSMGMTSLSKVGPLFKRLSELGFVRFSSIFNRGRDEQSSQEMNNIQLPQDVTMHQLHYSSAMIHF